MVFVVDTIALVIARAATARLLKVVFPNAGALFDGIDWREIESLPTPKRCDFVKALCTYPRQIAIWVTFTTPLKILPATLLMIFWWHTSDRSLQAIVVIGCSSMACAYIYGMAFIENHLLVTEILKEIHNRYDWADAFSATPLPYNASDFARHERSVIACTALMSVAVQWALITNPNTATRGYLALETISVWMTLFIFTARLQSQSRNLFMSGLTDIFQALEKFDPRKDQTLTLPISSSPVLARFATTFNTLMERLRSYERELSHWIFRKADEERYHALGEIAGLVVHDLGSPLQTLHWAVHHLAEHPDDIKESRYLPAMLRAVDHMKDLISSLRSQLTYKPSEEQANFGDSFANVMRILQTLVRPDRFAEITFDLDDVAKALRFEMRQADLNHIFFNLLSNSAKNLVDNKIADPVISIKVRSLDAEWVTLELRDNGTGLSREAFEALTEFAFMPTHGVRTGGGLGLRLTRRLIERNGGVLNVLPSAGPDERGTTMILRLKLAAAQQAS